jgi:primosomal protein N'
MRFVELIVNIPIRRSFAPQHEALPPVELADGGEEVANTPSLQTYHYHLPADLEGQVQPGHLVWAPFGRQTVQGIVIRLSDHAPVATRPIERLARPEPVLTSTQLALAAWLADYYVAPFSEAIKLFLPPGLLIKEGGEGVRAKRELQVESVESAPDSAAATEAQLPGVHSGGANCMPKCLTQI